MGKPRIEKLTTRENTSSSQHQKREWIRAILRETPLEPGDLRTEYERRHGQMKKTSRDRFNLFLQGMANHSEIHMLNDWKYYDGPRR